MSIIRELLEGKENISTIAERYSVNIPDIYRWKKQLFESVEVFDRKKKQSDKEGKRIEELETKLKYKDSVISEIVADNIELKKKWNGIK
jgi:transposase-like protein